MEPRFAQQCAAGLVSFVATMAGKLTTKQEAFVAAYIGPAKFNATKAAEMAGYPPRSAYQRGYELVKNSDVRARIDEHLEALTLNAKEVLAELTDIASADWREFVEILMRDDDGEPLRVRFDLRSKVQALELIGKHYKLFTDKVQHDGSEDFLSALRGFGAANGHGDA
jgi:phage terminase small subunit